MRDEITLDILTRAAKECGELALGIRKTGLTTKDKDDTRGSHFATQADELSQEKGIEIIRSKFPEEIIVAEEQANDPVVPKNCTVFDPIDGTTAFYNGADQFGVTVCTLRDGQPMFGAIYFPVDKMMITAQRGGGCFINGERIRLTWDRPIDKTMVGSDIGPWTVHEVLQGITEDGFVVRSLMAAVYGFRAVLMNETGMYYNLNAAKVWDAAAGVLAIEEAGGVAYAPDGSALKWDNIKMDWVVAANDELAEHVLGQTRKWPGRKEILA